MKGKVVQFPKASSLTIETVLNQFVEQFPGSEKAQDDCENTIELFTQYLDNYAYDSLSREEEKLFEYYYNLDGDKHKSFCQLFGPEKIAENTREFVSYFLVKKVMGSPTFLGKAVGIIQKLVQWLHAKSYVGADTFEQIMPDISNAKKNLPRAEKAAGLLWSEATDGTIFNTERVDESGYMDVTRLEDGKLWLRPIGGKEIGPVPVPVKVTDLLEVGWEVNCGLKKSGKSWKIVEVGCIYPH